MTNRYVLPDPPADVLALFDRLPPEVLEKIQLQMALHQGLAFIKLGREPSEEEVFELLLRGSEEFCRLICESAGVMHG